MVSRDSIFWEVDVQADFMLPGGKLYVPGAEKLLPNIRRLTDAARQGRVFLVSHGCFHTPNDPEFRIFPPHCVKGTAGAELVPEALTDRVARVPNDAEVRLPEDLSKYQQILLEKLCCQRSARTGTASGGGAGRDRNSKAGRWDKNDYRIKAAWGATHDY